LRATLSLAEATEDVMNELFKLGRVTEDTAGCVCASWIEITGDSCTTTFSPNNSDVHY
jgi:hypothetical protein